MLIESVKESNEEVLLLFPTINAFLRKYKIGIFDHLKESQNMGIVVKIITPVNDEINKIIATIKNDNFNNFIVYPFEGPNEIKINTITIVVIDKKESFVIEKIDDSNENFEDAVGLSIYSTSKPTV